ncbi:tail fiber protein [Aeromonas phage pAEv1810]|uniref:tail fiber protein n=1 Tax=Aeromonas phage pAEv1810 TaxID=2908744 RepID=UPI0023294E73|nr:tail fiber protein [Aeromonas phage pAEv1810]UIS25127.1 hypothetical protein pAEv1810_189 [Aeromonas phage pAEv1810]
MSFNTGNDLPSLDERDLYDNATNLDKAMNSTDPTWTDRFGVEKPTIDAALKSAGFMPAGFDFVTGGTLQPGDRNKAVYNPAPNGDNNWYRWNGSFPKEIAANSQPNPKDENNWVPVIFKSRFGRESDILQYMIGPNKVSITAHRGYWRFSTENSIKSITKAGMLGFDMVELDVEFTSDMVPVLLHDVTLDRTTSGTGSVRTKTFSELSGLYLTNDPDGDREPIPTFRDAVIACKKFGLSINIDWKFSGTWYDDDKYLRIVYDILIKEGYSHKSFFMINDHKNRLQMKNIDPTMSMGFLTTNPSDINIINTFYPGCLVGMRVGTSQTIIDQFLANKTPVYIYGCETHQQIEQALKSGASFIETNDFIPSGVI